MAKATTQPVTYIDREAQDGELHGAIAEILSAEQEAKRIIAQAEESVKAVQLDGATRERGMKEQSKKIMAAARDEAMADAIKRAEAEREKRIKAATAAGEELIKSKRKQIDALTVELYGSLGGKK